MKMANINYSKNNNCIPNYSSPSPALPSSLRIHDNWQVSDLYTMCFLNAQQGCRGCPVYIRPWEKPSPLLVDSTRVSQILSRHLDCTDRKTTRQTLNLTRMGALSGTPIQQFCELLTSISQSYIFSNRDSIRFCRHVYHSRIFLFHNWHQIVSSRTV